MAEDRKFTDDQLRAAARLSFEKLNRGHLETIQNMDVCDLPFELKSYAQDRLRWNERDANEFWNSSATVVDGLEAVWNLNMAGFDGYSSTIADQNAYLEILSQEVTNKIKDRHETYYGISHETDHPVPNAEAISAVIENQEPSTNAESLVEEQQEILFSTQFADFRDRELVKAAKKRKSPLRKKKKTDRPHPSAHLLASLVGDFPVNKYTRKMATEFKEKLPEVPQSFGKGKNTDVHKAIAEADADTDLFKGKTIKKHFSALSVFWKDRFDSDLVSSNIFLGHNFDVSDSDQRKPWTKEDLIRLFSDESWIGHDDGSAALWFPVVGLFSGMRMEEIANLSLSEGLSSVDGITYFNIVPHSDWTGKTPSAYRRVPVHSALAELGFERLVAKKRQRSGDFVFSDLTQTASSENRSASYSREFSRVLRRDKYPKHIVFHSFRHTFRTGIANSKIHQERHLDAVMGHMSPGGEKTPKQSIGRRYEHRDLFPIDILRDVVETFKVDDEVMRLLKSRLAP
jgi:integrase